MLIFCPTKAQCEALCKNVAYRFYCMNYLPEGVRRDNPGLPLTETGLRDTLEQLRRAPVGVDPLLAKCVPNGVAYHHAGRTTTFFHLETTYFTS